MISTIFPSNSRKPFVTARMESTALVCDRAASRIFSPMAAAREMVPLMARRFTVAPSML